MLSEVLDTKREDALRLLDVKVLGDFDLDKDAMKLVTKLRREREKTKTEIVGDSDDVWPEGEQSGPIKAVNTPDFLSGSVTTWGTSVA